MPGMRPHRVSTLLLVGFALAVLGHPAATAASPEPSPGPSRAKVRSAEPQVVLSGTVIVPRGRVVGDVVVFHGRAAVAGVVTGDVVVLDGPVAVTGQVAGSVVALNGPVRILGSAQVGGDVLGGERVVVSSEAVIGGRTSQRASFTLQGPFEALGFLLGGVAIATSVLVLGLLLMAFVPRGSERVATALRTSPGISILWGISMAFALPLIALALTATILGLPLGLTVALALAFVWLLGLTLATWALGRTIVQAPRSRWGAFSAGWAILAALGLVPYLGVLVWSVGAIVGLGAASVALWRARGSHGRHRAGYVEPEPPTVPATGDPGGSGAGLLAED
jgi:hypothetical protein